MTTRWLLTLAALLAPALASAHPPPLGVALRLDLRAGAPPRLALVVARRGVVTGTVGGGDLRLACLPGLGLAESEVPAVLFARDGSLVMGTSAGVRRGDGLCGLRPASGLEATFVQDLQPDPTIPDRVWAVTNQGGSQNGLFRSDDGGVSFRQVGEPASGALLNRVLVAPSDPARLYLGGSDLDLPAASETPFVRVSDDGGQTFPRAHALPLGPGEIRRRLSAVHPADPDVLFLTVTHETGSGRPDLLLRSDDAGAHFTTVLDSAVRTSDLVFDERGQHAWLAAENGLFRSQDGGRTFTLLRDDLLLGCALRAAGKLYACSWHAPSGFAVAVSEDGGATFETLLRFTDVDEPLRCAADPSVESACAEAWIDWRYEVLADAPSAAPARNSAGGCHLRHPDHPGAAVLAALFALGLAARRLIVGAR